LIMLCRGSRRRRTVFSFAHTKVGRARDRYLRSRRQAAWCAKRIEPGRKAARWNSQFRHKSRCVSRFGKSQEPSYGQKTPHIGGSTQVLRTRPLRYRRKRCVSPCSPGASSRRPRLSRSKLKETKMRVISQNELSHLPRSQLYSLLVQFQAVLSDLAEGSHEHRFAIETLMNIRAVLARKALARNQPQKNCRPSLQ
jgi:hypothetical protein